MKDKDRTTPPGEDYTIRCPRLGHQITFGYCRRERGELPCFKTLDCWHHHFDVEGHLRGELDRERWERAFSPPGKTKIMSLLDLIEEAKRKTDGEP